MGMTIEEQIEALKYLKKCGIFPFSDKRTGIVITDEYVDEAIDTMRKYQKIEQIYSDYLKYMNPDNLADRIGEVLEDGKDD